MAEIKRYKLCTSDITQGGLACKNPTIKWESLSENVVIPCVEGNCSCVDVEVLDDGTDFNRCINLIIDCEDCEACPPQIITKCLCDGTADCGACETCVDGLCTPRCKDKLCDETNDVCVDCTDDTQCEDGKECIGGSCKCPAGKNFTTAEGKCVSCIGDSNCQACETCVDGACIPIICTTGACNPESNTCVECMNAGDCGPNQVCENNTCTCSPGFSYDPISALCLPTPDCSGDNDCAACSMCVNGECTPIVCPAGKICVNGTCETECDCNNPSCNNGGCSPIGPNTCICKTCTGDCANNFDCGQGCECIDGSCQTNSCAGSCTNGSDCGDGCGCFEGFCFSCTSLLCEDESCNLTLGCECQNGNCESSACGNACDAHNECAFGCFCEDEDNVCHSCSELSCNNNECGLQVGCQCISGDCVASSEELFRCEPEVTQTTDGCIEVMLVLDKSGSMSNFRPDVDAQSNIFANSVLGVPGSRLGWLNFNHDLVTVRPIGTNPGNITIHPTGGATNYTRAYDTAVTIMNASTSGSPCRKYIIFFTDGKQNVPNSGPFPGTGLSATASGSIADENQLAVDMANVARGMGIETRVIGYGNIYSGWLEQIAGGLDNYYIAPYQNASQAFDEVFASIGTTTVTEATCVPAELSWTGDTFPTSNLCEDSCGKKFYTCTPNGCLEDPMGTLTRAQCQDTCNPDTYCDCSGGECTPIPGATSGQNCAGCIDACSCGQRDVIISYDCADGNISAQITGGNYPGALATVEKSDGTYVGVYNLAELQNLTLPSGNYIITISDSSGTANCNIVKTLTVDCCNSLQVIANSADVCAGSSVSLDFTILGGTAPYTYSIEQGARGPITTATSICGGTAQASPDNTTGVNPACTVTPTTNSVYDIVVTDAGGCTATSVMNVTVNNSLNLTASGYTGICSNAASADITFDVTGGTAPYTWELKRGTTVVGTSTGTASTYTYTENAPANGIDYTMTVTGANGCADTQTYTMATIFCDPCIVSTSNQAWCATQPENVTANVLNGLAPFTYSVTIDSDPNHPSNTTGTLATQGVITYVDNVTVNHTVTFEVTDSNGDTCTATMTATVSEYLGDLSVSCVNCNSALCLGDVAQFVASGGYAGGTTEWFLSTNTTNIPDGTGVIFGAFMNTSIVSVCAKSSIGSCQTPLVCAVASDSNCPSCDLIITGIDEASGTLNVYHTGCATGAVFNWTASNGGAITSGNGTKTVVTNGVGDYTVSLTCPGGVQQPCTQSISYNYAVTPCKVGIRSTDTSVHCQISMVASGSGTCGGALEYNFLNTGNGNDSGWISSPVYNFTDCCGTGFPCDECIWSVSVRCSTNTFCIEREFVTHTGCVN